MNLHSQQVLCLLLMVDILLDSLSDKIMEHYAPFFIIKNFKYFFSLNKIDIVFNINHKI